MSEILGQVGLVRGRGRPAAGAVRGCWRLLAALGLLLVGGACGTDAQTLRPYTPAEGVNVDVGDPADAQNVVHVRNLLIISKAPGSGILSASLVTDGRDELTGHRLRHQDRRQRGRAVDRDAEQHGRASPTGPRSC